MPNKILSINALYEERIKVLHACYRRVCLVRYEPLLSKTSQNVFCFVLSVLLLFSRYYLINTYGLNYINFSFSLLGRRSM